MFCIFAFIVFLILGIFSARYRGLAKKSWKCVGTKLTFRTCDVSLKEELRAQFIGSFIVKHPRFARFMDKWVDTIAFIFVALSIWSLLVVVNSGLNYYVYDTCSPGDPESCTLSAGGCGVGAYQPTFIESVKTGNVILWVNNDYTSFVDKFSRIPDRMKTWKAEEYISKTATYYNAFDAAKPTAVEMVDPGCRYCAQLFKTAKESGFSKKYNFTYLLYPIPNPKVEGEYKFKNSLLLAKYVEAVKKFPLKNSEVSSDWRLLEMIYTGKDEKGEDNQKLFNEVYSNEEAEAKIIDWLKSFGYTTSVVPDIKAYANNKEVIDSIKDQKIIVDQKVRTVKIPTIIFDGRRYDRAVDAETLLK